ncbi:MAG: molecular chaperone HtpG [Verrucomicrobiota bacterium]
MSTTAEKHTFQAEVRQLLDIVINSLYTDKEIFVRELVSNAADALEKMRRLQLKENEVFDDNLDLEINITTDDTANTITIADYGIGMTEEELVENLGTIAHSGSKAFVEALKSSGDKDANLIGQFGVGFYSAFMVSDEVKVYTHSWHKDGKHLCWSSDGKSGYEIEETEGQRRGCRIVIKLREDCEEFAKKERIEGILKQYSNFVSFPIHLNGDRVNKIEAIWLKSKKDVTDEEYNEFYKFAANAFDEPRYRMHFSADAPLAINSLVFVPQQNTEKFGFGPTDPGVALYCKKVLIDPEPKGLLPEWLRFLKGVIDSEDIPLNISRETMQDSALVQKLNQLITKCFIKFLESESKDEEKYLEFYKEFSRFIKEGVATDRTHQEQLAKLLRFESSMTEKGKTTSLPEYIDRAKEDQKQIFFQLGESREAIEASPYLEAFKARGLEVLFCFEGIDDYVLNNLVKFGEKEFTSIDRSDVDLDDSAPAAEGEALSEEDTKALCEWLQTTLESKVEKVQTGQRLVDKPAVALTPAHGMNPQMRQMMQAMQNDLPPVKVELEINPRHDLIKKLAAARESKPEVAAAVAKQICDNALLSAGLLESPWEMVDRVYDLMGEVI